MKTIQTKYFPHTNTKPARIKAFLADGGKNSFIYVTDDTSGETAHQNAAKKLCDKFVAEDEKRHGVGTSQWGLPFVTGYIKGGHYAHILLGEEEQNKIVSKFFDKASKQ
jgi:hypothetical protein